MSGSYEGDEWKYLEAMEDELAETRPVTRAEEQARINREYVRGRMPLERWRLKTRQLGDPEKWSAEGRLAELPNGERLRKA